MPSERLKRRRRRIEQTRTQAEDRAAMALEIRESLGAAQPWIPSKYFYDDRGSGLFEEITRLPEYYQTRTEERILETAADDILRRVRPTELVELGSGMGRKIGMLLDGMKRAGRLERCLLLDINAQALNESVVRLGAAYPTLRVSGIVGDFTKDLHRLGPGGGRMIAFFGGTIGNLHPKHVPAFLRHIARNLERGDGLLVGIDFIKDKARLEAAYNDSAGVTSRFNLNILQALNDGLGADFDITGFEHVAFYDTENAWIEMRVRARRSMRVRIEAARLELNLTKGDELRTEISCKYTRESLEALLPGTGLKRVEWYADAEGLFGLVLLERIAPHAA